MARCVPSLSAAAARRASAPPRLIAGLLRAAALSLPLRSLAPGLGRALPAALPLFGSLLLFGVLAPVEAQAAPALAPGASLPQDGGELLILVPEGVDGPLKAKPSRGKLAEPLIEGPLVRLRWTAAGEDGAPLQIELRYRDGAGQKVEANLSVPLAGPAAARFGAPLVRAPGAAAVELPGWGAGWRAVASRGEVKAAGRGASWTAPVAARPGLSLVAVVPPSAAGGPLVLPVVERAPLQLTLQAPPDSENTLLLSEGVKVGPLRASPAGTVAFTADGDPRVAAGTLLTVRRDGVREERAVPLLDPGPPVVLLLAPAAAPADPNAPQDVIVAVTDSAGAPWTGAAPTVEASAGSLGPLSLRGPGLYGATWQPPVQAGPAELRAQVGGQRAVARIVAQAGPPSANLQLAAAGASTSATLELRGPTGPWAGKAPGLVILGGPTASVTDKKGGRYAASLKLKPGAAVVVQPPPSGGLTPARVLSWARPGPDGAVVLIAVVEDDAGRGVPAQKLELRGPEGAPLALPPTGPGGLSAALVRGQGVFTVQLGGLRAAVWAGPGAAPTPVAPAEALPALARWQAAAPVQVVGAPPAPVVAAAPAPDPRLAARAPAPAAVAPVSTGPVASAPPTAAAPTAPPPAGAPSAPTRAPAAGGGAWARVHLVGVAGTGAYSSVQDGFRVGPEEVELRAGGLADGGGLGVGGAGLGALVSPTGGPLLVELEVRALRAAWAGRYRFPSAEGGEASAAAAHEGAEDLSARLGLRYLIPLSEGISAQVGAAGERSTGALVLWESSAPTWTTVPVYGLRAMGGLLVQRDRLFVDLQLAESLAPYPVRATGSAALELHLRGPVWGRLGYAHQWRRGTYDAGEEISTRSSLGLAELGLSLAW
ncbi:MAG: hypothetical protein JNM72_06575 [Deltaproteobacteria bacterium]|nr:hypothetical protein [Deltaproteobacteria bacterium]